jgi:hypothetical protein
MENKTFSFVYYCIEFLHKLAKNCIVPYLNIDIRGDTSEDLAAVAACQIIQHNKKGVVTI